MGRVSRESNNARLKTYGDQKIKRAFIDNILPSLARFISENVSKGIVPSNKELKSKLLSFLQTYLRSETLGLTIKNIDEIYFSPHDGMLYYINFVYTHGASVKMCEKLNDIYINHTEEFEPGDYVCKPDLKKKLGKISYKVEYV